MFIIIKKKGDNFSDSLTIGINILIYLQGVPKKLPSFKFEQLRQFLVYNNIGEHFGKLKSIVDQLNKNF